MADGFSSQSRGTVDRSVPRLGGSALTVAALTIAALYFGRDVFIPIALAILLSFVLAIPARLLQHWGLGRKLGVAVVVLLAFLGIGAIGGVLTTQLTQLAGDLPRYQTTIRDKIASLRDATTGRGPLERVTEMLQSLSTEFGAMGSPSRPPSAGKPGEATPDRPLPVEIVGQSSSPLQTIGAVVMPLLHPLATTGLVAIFVVFILLQRDDLRNRLIRLAGAHDLQRTTAAMNDAARRLSRFFLTQVLLNATFGLVIGLCLWLIGVPSPVLWGILAAISRFVPYVGVILAAGGPLLLAAAVDPHWSMLLETAILFAVVELAVGQLVEPLLYGRSTGLSPIAVIVSVTFWTWLWGGVGLLVATPLTVCLVVLGRHVDQLSFLEVMFGDRPPLTVAESFYQRMLAGDVGEGLEQAEIFLKVHPLATYYDEVALKGLALAQVDASRSALDEARLDRIEETIGSLVEELSDHEDVPAVPSGGRPEPKRADGDADLDASLDASDAFVRALPVLGPDQLRPDWQGKPVLCVAGRKRLDRAAAQMLAQLLGRHGIGAEIETAESLGSASVIPLGSREVRVACISFLDTSSPVYVRYGIRRIRRRFPDAEILVCLWGMAESDAKALCEASRSDHCAERLGGALQFCLDRAMVAQPDLAASQDARASASAA